MGATAVVAAWAAAVMTAAALAALAVAVETAVAAVTEADVEETAVAVVMEAKLAEPVDTGAAGEGQEAAAAAVGAMETAVLLAATVV